MAIELVVIVAVIIGLSQVAKDFIASKYIPLVAIALGVIAGIPFVDGDIATKIFVGIAMGLASCGLFDVTQIHKK